MSTDTEFIFNSLIRDSEIYVIQKGDSMSKVLENNPMAKAEGLILRDIIDANPGIDPNKLRIGQKIVIPTGKALQFIRTNRKAPSSNGVELLSVQIEKAFSAASSATGVPESILRGIAAVESNGNICTQSGPGAIGLMQLMPLICTEYGVDPMDPVASIWGAAKYLASLFEVARDLDAKKENPVHNIERAAITMYNYGETKYKEVLRSKKKVFPKEAAEYADKVLGSMGVTLTYHCNGKKV